MTRRKLPPIVWRKPTVQGEAPHRPMLSVDGLDPHRRNRFWGAFTLGLVLTPFACLSLYLVDGHWWKGNLSGSAAALLVSITAVPLGICIVSCWLLAYRGRAVARKVNSRNTIYGESRTEQANEVRREGIWKLLGCCLGLIIVELFLWHAVTRILAGLPLLDPGSWRYLRKKDLYDFLDIYLPHGPLTPILLMVIVAAVLLFLVRCVWLVLRYPAPA